MLSDLFQHRLADKKSLSHPNYRTLLWGNDLDFFIPETPPPVRSKSYRPTRILQKAYQSFDESRSIIQKWQSTQIVNCNFKNIARSIEPFKARTIQTRYSELTGDEQVTLNNRPLIQNVSQKLAVLITDGKQVMPKPSFVPGMKIERKMRSLISADDVTTLRMLSTYVPSHDQSSRSRKSFSRKLSQETNGLHKNSMTKKKTRMSRKKKKKKRSHNYPPPIRRLSSLEPSTRNYFVMPPLRRAKSSGTMPVTTTTATTEIARSFLTPKLKSVIDDFISERESQRTRKTVAFVPKIPWNPPETTESETRESKTREMLYEEQLMRNLTLAGKVGRVEFTDCKPLSIHGGS